MAPPVKRWTLKASRALLPTPASGVRILLFHEIKPSQREVFEALIRFLLDRYGFISPEDFNRGIRTGGVRFILSFDDGFISQCQAARDVLDPLGIKALFFVCPRFIGLAGKEAAAFLKGPMRRPDFSEATPELHPPSWEELFALSQRGHQIGSHTLNHASLSALSDEETRAEEIIRSGDDLEKKLGKGIDWFAYPFGSLANIDARSLQMVGRRYRYCCSGLRGINTDRTHRLCLTREVIDLDQPLDHLKGIALGGFDFYYYFKQKKFFRMAGPEISN